jgi:ABC-type uncharacterized transport system permease subunit
MLTRVCILCFAASYAIVLLLEISRLVFRSGVRGAVMVGWAVAGLAAHSIYLFNRAVADEGVPLSSWRDWFLVAAWFLMIVYLYLIYYHPRNMPGVFLMPMVLGLIGMAWFVVSPEPFARRPASQIWGGIHGVSIGLAAASMLFGFAAGMMYLRQDHRLKHKIPPGKGLKLPSLEWLQSAAVRSMVASTVLVAVGVLSGMLLNLIHRQEPGDRLPWFDPFILGTTLLFVWLLFSVHLSYLFRQTRRGRLVAYLAILGFVVLAVVLSVGLFMNSRHGSAKGEGGRGKAEITRERQSPDWRLVIANRKLQIANCKLNDAIDDPLSLCDNIVSPLPSPLSPPAAHATPSRWL